MPTVANKGSWSRGYDVALTWRRSAVQFRPGPFTVCEPEFEGGVHLFEYTQQALGIIVFMFNH